jgi:acyl carrier protein
MQEEIIAIVREHGRFASEQDPNIQPDTDLFAVGLTSHASAVIMLAIETELGVTFPDHMLTRDVFQSVSSLANAVQTLRSQAAAGGGDVKARRPR